jgi:hypothetical protein
VTWGEEELEEKAVEVPKNVSADMGLRKSWCDAGNRWEAVAAWAFWGR